MNKKSISRIAFSFALAVVMLIAGANISLAQLRPGGGNTCPATACPTNLSDYTHIGSCITPDPHCPDSVLQCNVWESSNGFKCYNNCGWQ